MSNYSLYHSPHWKKVRARVLRRDKYKCRECLRYGRTSEAATVHHITPVEDLPALVFEAWNLLSLCGECHNRMHDRNTGALTERGKWWRDKRPPSPDRKIENEND